MMNKKDYKINKQNSKDTSDNETVLKGKVVESNGTKQKICPRCGALLHISSSLCNHCGAMLEL